MINNIWRTQLLPNPVNANPNIQCYQISWFKSLNETMCMAIVNVLSEHCFYFIDHAHCFYFIDHAFDYWFYLAYRLWWYQVCSEVAFFQVAPKNDSVRSPKIDTRLVEILSITRFVSTEYPLLVLFLIPPTKLHYHILKMRLPLSIIWKLSLFFPSSFFFF